MKDINFTLKENRTDFLSVDNKKAISSHGELFTVGDLVKRHKSIDTPSALIKKFSLDKQTNEVIAFTEIGIIGISSLTKVFQVEI